MHAPVRDEPEQVDVLATLERAAQRLVLEELAAFDRLVHAHEVLEEDAARADREVPDLGVAHLACRQADGLAGSLELPVRIVAPEPVEDGRLGELDRVSRPGWSDPPAVEDDERYEGIRAAVSHIALKESTSRDAPPTRAPSTSGCASSAPALSGLTEPPYRIGASSSDLMKACASWAISGVAVRPVPIAHTGSYASTSSGCDSSPDSWRRRTASGSPPLRSSLVPPVQAITRRAQRDPARGTSSSCRR